MLEKKVLGKLKNLKTNIKKLILHERRERGVKIESDMLSIVERQIKVLEYQI